MSTPKTKARFIQPMLLLKTEKLPETDDRLFELKLDGYRAIAYKTGGKVYLRSRNGNDFNGRYPISSRPSQHCPTKQRSTAK